MGYVTLKPICREGADVKIININYLIIDTTPPYNILLGRPTINALGAAVFTWYLTLNFFLLDGRVGTIRGDQQATHKCYLSSLKTVREELTSVSNTNFEDWDPILGIKAEWITPIEYLKEVQIEPHAHQVTQTDTSLFSAEEKELVNWLRRNVDLFVWAPSDIQSINIKVVSHCLVIHPSAKP